MRKCRACECLMPKSAAACPQCGISQKIKECPTCAELMTSDAQHCNACHSYRDLRRFIPITSSVYSGLSTLFAVLALFITHYANFQNRESKTSISFTGADNRVIYVHVANSGRKPSTLRAYRLKFGDMIETERLVLLTGDGRDISSVIPAEGEARIGLLVRGLTPARKHPDKEARYKVAEIDPQLDAMQVTLEIEVEESNGRFVRSVEFEVFQIRTLIQNKLSDYGEG